MKDLEEVRSLAEAINRKLTSTREDLEEELREAERERDQLRQRVAELERYLDADLDGTPYNELTKEQKVYQVRQKLVEIAEATDGTAALKYDDVRKHFGGKPSAGHCYNLMKHAGKLDGFEYDRAGGGEGDLRVRVKLDAVNEESVFQSVNNGDERSGVDDAV
jgi:hypothetical protein